MSVGVGVAAAVFCQYSVQFPKRQTERERERQSTRHKQENVIPAKRSKLPANTGTDASMYWIREMAAIGNSARAAASSYSCSQSLDISTTFSCSCSGNCSGRSLSMSTSRTSSGCFCCSCSCSCSGVCIFAATRPYARTVALKS